MKIIHAILAALVISVSGCGGSGGGGSNPDTDPDAGITTRSADLVSYVSLSLNYVQSFSEGYVIPSAASLDQFDTLVAALIARLGDAVAAAVDLDAVRDIAARAQAPAPPREGVPPPVSPADVRIGYADDDRGTANPDC